MIDAKRRADSSPERGGVGYADSSGANAQGNRCDFLPGAKGISHAIRLPPCHILARDLGNTGSRRRGGARRIPKTRIREEVSETSVEENLRKLDEAMEALEAHDFDRLDRMNAESIILRAGQPEPQKGRAAVREWNQAFATAFPDIRFRKERSFGQGDWVAAEGVFTGTHKGPLVGPGGRTIPATNKRVRVPMAALVKIEGGEFTELAVYSDQLALLNQLGINP